MMGVGPSSAATKTPGDDDGVEVVMPRLSKTVDRAAVVRWFVTAGQSVGEGDVLAEVGADNVTMEIEADAKGVVQALVVPAGPDLLAAGTPIALLKAGAPEVAIQAGPTQQVASQVTLSTDTAEEPGAEADPQSVSDMSFAVAIGAGLAAQMRQDPDVFVIGESVADFGRCSAVVAGLAEEFGHRRVIGTPITPHAAVGLAVGAAMAGLKPVVEVTAWALALQAIDPIISSAAKTRYRSAGRLGVPIVLRGRDGIWPGSGPMHSVSLASWFASTPGLKVVCPATPACAKGLMRSAILDPDPVIILEADALYETIGPVPDDDAFAVPIGKARVARAGDALTIVTYGQGVAVALAAAAELAASGISAEIIDLRTLRPIDMTTVLASVRKTGLLLTLDGTVAVCSIGAEICAGVTTAAFGSLKSAPVRIAAADTPVPYAANLEALVLPDAGEVAAKAMRLAGHSRV